MDEPETQGSDTHIVGFKKAKNSLACKICSLIKDAGEFEKTGCDNCNEILEELQIDTTDILTSNFEGVVALLKPDESWVARYQSINKFHPGLYAVAVYERPSKLIINNLLAKGYGWRNRDGKEH